jgi:hypothetical protein
MPFFERVAPTVGELDVQFIGFLLVLWTSTSLLVTSAMSQGFVFGALGAVKERYAGWAGNTFVELDESNDSFEVSLCPGDNSTQYRITRNGNGEIVGVRPTGAPKSRTRQVSVAFSKGERFGIPLEIVDVTGLLPQRKATVRLERAKDKSAAIVFGSWAQCPRIGYFPGLLVVLIVPGHESDLKDWATKHTDILRSSDADRPDEEPDAPKNVFILDSIEGQELTALKEIGKLPFVIAARMIPVPYGPPSLLIDFPIGTLPKAGDNPSAFADRLAQVLRSAFPRSLPSDYTLGPDKGLRYVAQIFGPANRFVPSPDYKGTWLKTELVLRFYRSPTEKAPLERLLLDIPDGFLPRWPVDSKEPPPQDHYRQFHLSPDGKGKTEDLTILNELQANLSKAFASKWRGQIID